MSSSPHDQHQLAPWGHRPALDGVRTISVYLVVAFHAGISLFAGGFIGVDMFFVLSGYLVTTVLWTDLTRHGRIRFGHFYSRRARRLIPAALVAIVTIAALMVLVASRISRLGYVNDGQAAAIWFANWHFIREASDYFAAASDKSPYLHYWSLSIEEQFYVLFPLLLWGLTALARRMRRPLVVPAAFATLAILSVIVQLSVTGESRAYYGTDARAYQLLFGAVAALAFDRARTTQWSLPQPLKAAAGPAAFVGLAVFVLVSLDRFAVSVTTRGLVAAVVSLAVVACLELNTASRAVSMLSVAPMTYLGTISYGTYLWHWPIIVAWQLLYPATSPWTMFAISTVGATALAAASHAAIEMPLRRARPSAPYWPIVAVGVASGLAVALILPTILRSETKPVLRQWVNERSTVQDSDLATGDDDSAQANTPDGSAASVPTNEPSELVPPGQDANNTGENGEANGGENNTGASSTGAEDGANGGANNTGANGGANNTGADVRAEADTAPEPTGPVAIPDADTLQKIFEDRVPEQEKCKVASPEGCVLRAEGSPKVLLLGDSSARLLMPALIDLAEEHDFSLAANTGPGCPWQQGLQTTDRVWQGPCVRTQRTTYRALLKYYKPDVVITFALGRETPEIVEIGGFVGWSDKYKDLPALEALDQATRDSTKRLLNQASTVIHVEPVPLPPQEPMDCLSIYDDARECTFTHHYPEAPTEVVYRAIAANNDKVITVDLDPLSCPHYPTCELIDSVGDVVYRDGLHVWQGYYSTHKDKLWAVFGPYLGG